MATWGVDTNVLVYWMMAEMPEHRRVEAFLEREVYAGANDLALAPQVLYEFIHVVTDGRRFEHPLTVSAAVLQAERIWKAREVRQIHAMAGVLPMAFDLIHRLKLGRKRILDTVLAATLRVNGIDRLLTANVGDFEPFDFLEVVSPL